MVKKLNAIRPGTTQFLRLDRWQQALILQDAYRKSGYQFCYSERTHKGYLTIPDHICTESENRCELTYVARGRIEQFFDIDASIKEYNATYRARYEDRCPAMMRFLPGTNNKTTPRK